MYFVFAIKDVYLLCKWYIYIYTIWYILGSSDMRLMEDSLVHSTLIR